MPGNLQASPTLPVTSAMELPGDLEADNPLWRFALEFWRLPSVQEASLALQNEGWSVTRILCAGWLALNNRVYTGSESTKVTEWRGRVTGCLRAARQSLPKAQAPYSALRLTLAELELEAEKIELALAWQTIPDQNPEKHTIHTEDELIHTNLAAAAPEQGTTAHAQPFLDQLGAILSDFKQRDASP
ncbi:DUF2390 domain-containing protein [Marinobacter piscensis]|uniref:DUF2390 domain-containing protein n=1 Tax=Marinobacter piscensis TaxID=1562308 RepID=UPI001FE811D5|nr:DUF2390 domain-containing protein [Marinobacter piscensis]